MQEGGRKKNKENKMEKKMTKKKKSRIFFYEEKNGDLSEIFARRNFFFGRVKVEFGAFRVFIIPTLYFETWSSMGFKMKFLGIRF